MANLAVAVATQSRQAIATGESGGAGAAAGTAARIARAVARGSGAHNRIYRRDLVEFFSLAAKSFGQASDGQREAAALMQLLVPHDKRSGVEGVTAGNVERGEVCILERVFAEYLARRFSSHPAHLDELAHVAADMGRLHMPPESAGVETRRRDGEG